MGLTQQVKPKLAVRVPNQTGRHCHGHATWNFAQEWPDGWNSHDLDRFMAHYHEEVVFRSARAQALVGKGELVGHSELRRYWAKALKHQPELKFQVQDVLVEHEMLDIIYSN